MKLFDKKALSVEKQVDLLISRGLIVENKNDAINLIKVIGYYHLSSYMRSFQFGEEHHFFDNTNFKKIITLYNFDQELRQLTFNAIGKIEVAYRAAISNIMCEKFGSHWFCNKEALKNEDSVEILCSLINKEISKSKPKNEKYTETFIANYYKKYSSPQLPPFWMVAETFTLGSLNCVYKNISFSCKNLIMSSLGFEKEKKFMSGNNWLFSLNVVRNICAHHSRLFNRVFKIAPTKHQFIKEFDACNTTYYYIALIINLYLKTFIQDNSFEAQLINLFKRYPEIDKTKMGFPFNWNNFNISYQAKSKTKINTPT